MKITRSFSSVADRIINFKQQVRNVGGHTVSSPAIINLCDASDQPPQFMRDYIMEFTKTGSMQYTVPSGIPSLLESIGRFYQPMLRSKLNAMTQITILPGSTVTLNCALLAFTNPYDEVIVFEPSFEYYRPQIEFSGAQYVGVALAPHEQSWNIDWRAFESKFTSRTKMLILNTPHNPTGKIFSEEEMKEISKILLKHPQVIVVLDETHSSVCYDAYRPFQIPRLLDDPQLNQRTLLISSAGQSFGCSGLGVAYAIGSEQLITGVRSINQYHFFCVNEPFQKAVARAFDECAVNGYFEQQVLSHQNKRNALLTQLNDSKMGFRTYVPQGGSFLVTDISDVSVPDDPNVTKDKAFVQWYNYLFELMRLLDSKQVQTYPLSGSYSEMQSSHNFVRWSFRGPTDDINKVRERLQT